MQNVPSIPPPTYTGLGGREVKGLTDAHAVKPVQERGQPSPDKQHEHRHEAEHHEHPEVQQEDRRKYCRRVSHQPVLVELRSGIERRRHNLFVGGIVEHIDEEA